MLTSLFRLPILLSLYLLWWLALGVTAAAHLLWWPLLSCLRGFSFCSSSAASSSSYFCYGCCQLLLSLLGVSVQLVLVHLLWPLSGGCLSLHWQAWRDRDAEPLGCRGAAGGLLSALPQHSSSFQCSHSNAFFQPHLHQGAVLEEVTLGFIAKGAVELHSTPFSRLLQLSVRSVEDLGVMASGHRPLPSYLLCGRVSLPDGDHSVCAPVGASGGLDGLHHSDGSVPSSAGSSSFSSLSSLHVQRHYLSFQSAVLWPLPCSAGLPQGHGSCFCYTPFSGGPYETVSRRLARPVTLSGVPPRGSSDCSPTLSRVGGCGQPPAIQPGSITGGSVSRGCNRLRLFQGISRLQSTAAEFQSCASPTAGLWLSLLGVLSLLAHLVPGGRLRMRSLQLCLHRSWDRQDLEAPVYKSMECLRDIQWWLHLPRLALGVSLCQVSPDLHFWSAASDVGWGAHLDRQIASGLWAAQQAALSLTPGNC